MCREYTVVLIPDLEDGGYTVRVPALPEVISDGRTIAEATERAKEAIELYLEVLKERGEEIPEETQRPQTVTIKVAA